MNYEYGLLILACLLAGVIGRLLVDFSWHRRLLALEEGIKAVLIAYDDRLNELTRIVTRQDKREAGETRWKKKNAEDEATLKALTDTRGESLSPAVGHPWDPRTWGKS